MYRIRYHNEYETWKESRVTNWSSHAGWISKMLERLQADEYARDIKVEQLVDVTQQFFPTPTPIMDEAHLEQYQEEFKKALRGASGNEVVRRLMLGDWSETNERPDLEQKRTE